jgi:hypothetical protein
MASRLCRLYPSALVEWWSSIACPTTMVNPFKRRCERSTIAWSIGIGTGEHRDRRSWRLALECSRTKQNRLEPRSSILA